MGNLRFNAVYEYSVNQLKKPTKQSEQFVLSLFSICFFSFLLLFFSSLHFNPKPRVQRKMYIEEKYLKREYIARPNIDVSRTVPLSPEEVLLLLLCVFCFRTAKRDQCLFLSLFCFILCPFPSQPRCCWKASRNVKLSNLLRFLGLEPLLTDNRKPMVLSSSSILPIPFELN